MPDRPGKKQVNLQMDRELVEQLDNFRWRHRMPSRLAVIEFLLRTSLKLNPVPPKTSK